MQNGGIKYDLEKILVEQENSRRKIKQKRLQEMIEGKNKEECIGEMGD